MPFGALVVVLSASLAGTVTSDVPPGWRNIEPSELHGLLQESDLRVRADFDGDGTVDRAEILLRVADNARGAFIFLERSGGSEVLELGLSFVPDEFGLGLFEPGCYHGEEDTLCLPSKGLLHNEIEYGMGTLYWFERGHLHRESFYRGRFKDWPR